MDLVTFTEEIFNGKLHFLSRVLRIKYRRIMLVKRASKRLSKSLFTNFKTNTIDEKRNKQ